MRRKKKQQQHEQSTHLHSESFYWAIELQKNADKGGEQVKIERHKIKEPKKNNGNDTKLEMCDVYRYIWFRSGLDAWSKW